MTPYPSTNATSAPKTLFETASKSGVPTNAHVHKYDYVSGNVAIMPKIHTLTKVNVATKPCAPADARLRPSHPPSFACVSPLVGIC